MELLLSEVSSMAKVGKPLDDDDAAAGAPAPVPSFSCEPAPVADEHDAVANVLLKV